MKRIALVAAIVTAAALGFAWWSADRAPSDDLDAARRALAEARDARAAEFAPVRFREAEEAWRSSLAMMDDVNASIAPVRSYDPVRSQIDRTVGKAREALFHARHVADSLATALETRARLGESRTRRLEEAASFYPAGFVDRQRLIEARVLASGRDAARAAGDLWTAVRIADRHLAGLELAEDELESRLLDVAAGVPGWRAQLETLLSRKDRPFVVVDKTARKLTLHRPGRIDSFDVEFGRDWLGPKRVEGDGATPEGLYRVVRRLGRGETRYHRALLLDYPNASDRARFEADRSAGRIPAGARIGGLIELHGGGGRSVDWTDGCVALTDSDMERLFSMVPEGTPVLIAGALDADLPHARPEH